MSDIFISYASEDREIAGALAGALAAMGWSVWWDRSLLPGSRFEREIEDEIARARAMVVLWSRSSVESDWVRSEADEGRRREILIPALLDDARIPLVFRSIQTASLVGWDGAAAHHGLGDLKDGLSELLGPPPEEPLPTDADSGGETGDSGPWALAWRSSVSTRMQLAAVAGLALLLGGVIYLVCRDPDTPGNTDGMVFVPAGAFHYGCNEQLDSRCRDDEKPGGTRSLEAFHIGRTEVTVAAYAECLDAGVCSLPGETAYCNWGEGDRSQPPINCVDWNQAAQYCKWRDSGLPTELQWEKAARGTDGRVYPHANWGVSCGQAVITEDDEAGCGRGTTWPVGSKPAGASPYGALDMIGNVNEWTADWYDASQERRVKRGASTYTVMSYDRRVSRRWADEPDDRSSATGFRCAR